MTTNTEQWTPPTGSQAAALPTGTWWDAVRVPENIGEHALGVLGARSGAVIKDRCNTLYWLIAPGSAATWNLYRVHVLGAVEGVATYLGVPPVDRLTPPGSHWRVPFTRDGYLTDPRLLYKALIRALLSAAGDGRRDGR
ncbi:MULTISPECIES: hypothetical protein [Streptomyces violaceusniger group]|uniref:Uncharacterized protein n=2 Tax=Streptomyces rhizosphaericus TaxID=114699 RepID=A0ABP4D4J3_9ACTN|nr:MULTISPECIES: hypothetical protein [Streptomyces violaceusniger group]